MDPKRFKQLLAQEIEQMCRIALVEDLAGEDGIDITAELIPADKFAKATLITRENGVLCGTAWVEEIFRQLGNQVSIDWNFSDGDNLNAGDILCTLQGNARALLTGERSAMNFLQSLCATASLTAKYVSLVQGNRCELLDTRKTIPGMRFGQKYAVTCGAGRNHRMGLSDAFLIKENHIMACGSIGQALTCARQNHPEKLLEIEVETISELVQALDGKAQIIMLDNFDSNTLREAVNIRNSHENPAKLEASGNVSLETIAEIAETGVDYISVGALTKSIQALDLSLRIQLEK